MSGVCSGLKGAKDAAGDAANSVADSFMERLIEGTLNGLVEIIGTLSMAMFGIPGPDVGSVEGGSVQPSATLAHTFGALSWIIIALTVISLMVAIVRMFWTLEAGESKVVVRMMINLIASTTVILGMTVLMLEFADKASPWLLTRISGYKDDELNSGEKFAEALMGIDMSGSKGVTLFADLALIGLILLVITFFGVLMQIIFMLVRNPLIVAMCAFLPLFAASSGTRGGQERFNKALAFLIAFVIYKPVAAILLGIGLRMLKPLDAEENPLLTFLSGAILVALTGFALPAMVKLFVPEAAVGSSNAFSGGAGIAAAGAAVMSTAMLAGAFATGGSSAAAAGAGAGGPAGPPPGGDGLNGGGGGPPPPPPPPPPPAQLPAGKEGGAIPAGGEAAPALPRAQDDTTGGGPDTPTGDPTPTGPAAGQVVSSAVVPDTGDSTEAGDGGRGPAGDDGVGGSPGPAGDDGLAGSPGPAGNDGPASGGDAPDGGGGPGPGNAPPGAPPQEGPPRTPEGAQVVGARAVTKAAGEGGARVARGANTATNEMAEERRA